MNFSETSKLMQNGDRAQEVIKRETTAKDIDEIYEISKAMEQEGFKLDRCFATYVTAEEDSTGYHCKIFNYYELKFEKIVDKGEWT